MKKEVICQGCGVKFVPKRPDRAKYHSQTCSVSAPRKSSLPRNVSATARKLRKRRLELGLTQPAIAAKLGVTKQLYSLIERGRMPLKPDDGERSGPRGSAFTARIKHAKKLAKILGLKLSDLTG